MYQHFKYSKQVQNHVPYLCGISQRRAVLSLFISLHTQAHFLPISRSMSSYKLPSPYLSIDANLSYSLTSYFPQQMGTKHDCPLL